MCQGKLVDGNNPYDAYKELYTRYKGVYNKYLNSKVLPSILKKHDDDDVSMLQELVKRWENHKVMVTKLARYFNYMDRHYTSLIGLPSLKDVGFDCFREIVYEKMKVNVKDVVIALVNIEREGNENEIDRCLVKDVVDIFVEIENGKLDCYVNDLETAVLTDLVDYYTGKGFYENTPIECLQMEKDRVSHYLHPSSKEKLLSKEAQVLPERTKQGHRKKIRFSQCDVAAW
ncbi:cullin-1-like [Papaver somniferum]|uniref:cullin-1-like n=1 Tax=Papaver somniferum TaxID=3469 RepID=UPI000E6FDDF6|nr:cullin-1-like [Papaver somniferum]